MNKSLIKLSVDKTHETLIKSVEKRKKQLMRWSDKYEQLKMHIDTIAETYAFRVGRLYARDNVLDIEIIRFKKIKELMDLGIPFSEAVEEIKHRYKSAQEESDAFFDFEIPLNVAQFSQENATSFEEIRKLWKKLLHAFHPDLTTDKKEKEKRTEMVKMINAAYKNNDLQTLQQIQEKEQLSTVVSGKSQSVSELEQALITIENAVLRIKNQYKELKTSEWYAWTKLPKSKQESMLADLETRIRKDILEKESVLANLKKQTETA